MEGVSVLTVEPGRAQSAKLAVVAGIQAAGDRRATGMRGVATGNRGRVLSIALPLTPLNRITKFLVPPHSP